MNEGQIRLIRKVVPVAVALVAGVGCGPSEVVEIGSGFDFLAFARPALTEDGRVTAARRTSLLIGDGRSQTTIDLASHDLAIRDNAKPDRPVHLAEGGDIVLAADRSGTGCDHVARGAYHLDPGGTNLTVLREDCDPVSSGSPPIVGRDIGLAPNGTVAFSQIGSGTGAIYRGPAAGPAAVLRSGDLFYYNTSSLDVSDSGKVAVQVEYDDPVEYLRRGIFVFGTPEEDPAAVETAVDGLDVGDQPFPAINASGEVAFSLDEDATMLVGGVATTLKAGVYKVKPTRYHATKTLLKVASASDGYCRFGAVDINDAGTVVFEASLQGEPGCLPDSYLFSGIFNGRDPDTNRVIAFGDARLQSHRYFDTIRLGELNNSGQVSFSTRYTEPLVPTFAVWRWSP